MDEERKNRYKQKINFIAEKIESFPKPGSQLEIDALLYRMQVAIDAAMDISAMLVKDKGRDVQDDYYNIQTLADINAIKSKLGEQLKRLNGLRNAIVHKYNKFEEDEAVAQRGKVRDALMEFLEVVENEAKP